VSAPSALALVVAVALGTYLMRAGLIVLLSERTLPPRVVSALRHVGPAVLSALVVSLAAGGSGASAGITGPEVVALGVAALVAWWRRNLIASLIAGMAVLWIGNALT
jgi:branched-subunit amino acid transport protein